MTQNVCTLFFLRRTKKNLMPWSRRYQRDEEKHGRVGCSEGIRYSTKRGSLDSDSPAAKCASANEWLCSSGWLDDDGDDDEFMTMIISGGVPLCRHRCLSFRRRDSGVKKTAKEWWNESGSRSFKDCSCDWRWHATNNADKLVLIDWDGAGLIVGVSKPRLNHYTLISSNRTIP